MQSARTACVCGCMCACGMSSLFTELDGGGSRSVHGTPVNCTTGMMLPHPLAVLMHLSHPRHGFTEVAVPVRKLRLEWRADHAGVPIEPELPAGYTRVRFPCAGVDPEATAEVIKKWINILKCGFEGEAWSEALVDSRFRTEPTWDPASAIFAEHVDSPGEIAVAGLAWLDTVGDEWGRVSVLAVSFSAFLVRGALLWSLIGPPTWIYHTKILGLSTRGASTYTPHTSSSVQIHWVVVSPQHRRRGLGKWLVQAIIHHHVAVNHVRKVYLRTEDFRLSAIQLYERCGFVVIGEG